jgi:hypothetical protein
MPKLVCVKCQIELRPSVNGVTVIEMASFGPYKVWAADEWECPGCGQKIISGFSNEPIRQDHYADDFPQWLEHEIERATKVSKVIWDFERPLGGNDAD